MFKFDSDRVKINYITLQTTNGGIIHDSQTNCRKCSYKQSKKLKNWRHKDSSKDNIHIFAHFKERADDINDALDTSDVGMKEQGILEVNEKYVYFSWRRTSKQNGGCRLIERRSREREQELDKGKLVIIAHKE